MTRTRVVCSVRACAALPVEGYDVCAVHLVAPEYSPDAVPDGDKCEACDGSGKCNECDGSGVSECHACSHEVGCDACRFSDGKCVECQGTGRA